MRVVRFDDEQQRIAEDYAAHCGLFLETWAQKQWFDLYVLRDYRRRDAFRHFICENLNVKPNDYQVADSKLPFFLGLALIVVSLLLIGCAEQRPPNAGVRVEKQIASGCEGLHGPSDSSELLVLLFPGHPCYREPPDEPERFY